MIGDHLLGRQNESWNEAWIFFYRLSLSLDVRALCILLRGRELGFVLHVLLRGHILLVFLLLLYRCRHGRCRDAINRVLRQRCGRGWSVLRRAGWCRDTIYRVLRLRYAEGSPAALAELGVITV